MKRQSFVILAVFLLVAASIAVDTVESESIAEFVPNEFIVTFDKAASRRVLSDIEDSGGVVLEQIPSLMAVRVHSPSSTEKAFASAMKKKPGVTHIERNYIFKTAHVPNDPYWDDQWNMRIIEANASWDIHEGKFSVLVAIVDSGIDYNHDDLSEHYVQTGYDWVNDDYDPVDDWGHGTHCAGIAAAIMDNDIGVAGVAQVSLMAEKVLSSGSGSADNVAQGIIHAALSGADVISMSFGGPDTQIVKRACALACSRGSILVASAGNSNSSTPKYPAAYPEVIAVSATDRYDDKASYSNYGDWIELSAPGGDGDEDQDKILSTYLNSSYTYFKGTSMAAPHVSGLAALVWSYNCSFTNEQLREHLRDTSDDLGDPGKDPYYGYGRINAYQALNESEPLGLSDNPPACSIADPIENQTIEGVYRVKVNATDDSGVSLVELRIGSSVMWINITGNFDGTYYYYDWDTTSSLDGPRPLIARAKDSILQKAYSPLVTVIVDND